ncbi:hypothetical protein N9Z73_00310, partial [bacterium]|nr:hypothetical protein [bacterium]
IRLAHSNLNYLVTYLITSNRFHDLRTLILSLYPVVLLIVLIMSFSGFGGVEQFYLGAIVYFTFIHFFFIMWIRGFEFSVSRLHYKEHFSLTLSDFMVSLKTAIPRYFFESLLGLKILGVILICQQVSQIQDIYPASIIKSGSRKIVELSKKTGGKLLLIERRLLIRRIFGVLIIFQLFVLIGGEEFLGLIYKQRFSGVELPLALFLLVRMVPNLSKVDKFILNVINKTILSVKAFALSLGCLASTYLLLSALNVSNLVLLVLPLIILELYIFTVYRNRVKSHLFGII